MARWAGLDFARWRVKLNLLQRAKGAKTMTEYEIIRFFKFLLTFGIGWALWECALTLIQAFRRR